MYTRFFSSYIFVLLCVRAGFFVLHSLNKSHYFNSIQLWFHGKIWKIYFIRKQAYFVILIWQSIPFHFIKLDFRFLRVIYYIGTGLFLLSFVVIVICCCFMHFSIQNYYWRANDRVWIDRKRCWFYMRISFKFQIETF